MTDGLNDIDKQHLIRNAKILREVNFDRAAKDAVTSVKKFREVFFKCYAPCQGSIEVFDRMDVYLDTLSKMTPKTKKEKRTK